MSNWTTFWSVEWEGQDEVKRELLRVKQHFETQLELILIQAGKQMQGHVQDMIETEVYLRPIIKKRDKTGKPIMTMDKPHLTGFLKANWVTFLQSKLGDDVHRIFIATNTHYAPYINFGTKDEKGRDLIEARKFMEKAWRLHSEEVLTFIHNEVAKMLKSGGGFK